MKVETPEFVGKILEKFLSAGFEIYVVGGAVRDWLLGRPIVDWDFATNATPKEILNLFPRAFYDNAFGTVMMVDAKDEELYREGKLGKVPVYDITTFRKEVGYTDRRHPDKVEWGESLVEDLSRRDFTIGAMALRPEKRGGGEFNFQLIDSFGGQKDLEARLIRTVGEAGERFAEDALRMMRAVRIAAQLGLGIEQKTLEAMKQNAGLIKKIAGERIRDELFKILVTDFAVDAIKVMLSSGLLGWIIPELVATWGIEQGGHHRDDVWIHSLKSLDKCPSKDAVVRLATLIHDVGKAKTRAFVCEGCGKRFKGVTRRLICPGCGVANDYRRTVTFYNHEMAGARVARRLARQLKLSNKDAERLVILVRYHMFTVDERQTDKAIRRFIRHVGKENLGDMLDLRIGDRLGGGARETSWRLERFKKRLIEVQKQPFAVKDLKIDGHRVMKILGIKPGPRVGEVLNKLFEQVVEKKLENKKEALAEAVKKLG